MTTSQEIKNNESFINEGILSIDEKTLKALFIECGFNWLGLSLAGGTSRDKMEDILGLVFICSFKPELAKTTPAGRIKKSEFENEKCFNIEIQQPEKWFKLKFNK